MKKVLLTLAVVALLGGGSCLMAGCSYTVEHKGMTTHRAQIAGVGEECVKGEDGVEVCTAIAALSAEMKFQDFVLKVKGDPLAFALRVVNDGAALVRKIISLFSPIPTVGT